MILRSAACVLITLAFCKAENVPRWSKPDQDPRQGDWVPLNSERLNQEPARIPSAISPPQQASHALLRHPSPHQFNEEYQQKQVFTPPHGAPTRIALLHPQGINPQAVLQPQIPPQQLLAQFLNQQIEQSSLPIFSRALLQGQSGLNPNFYPQQENYNLKPSYNQLQEFQNGQYNLNQNRDVVEQYEEKDKKEGSSVKDNSSPQKIQETNYSDESYNRNSSALNEKEEVQILYVPVEMLKQQEQVKNAARNIPIQNERHPIPHEIQNVNLNSQAIISPKESRKFRHPIQPLKEQVPAYHLRGTLSQGKLTSNYPTPESEEEKESVKNIPKLSSYNNPRTASLTRNEYTSKYSKNNVGVSPNKEQIGDESTIQDEVSEFRNLGPTRRTPQKENINGQVTTLPPPNQPPLSVFMETTPNNRVGDVLGLLKGSKTIPVLDAIGPDAPQVFVGPSNLNTPSGYIKFELPYLSSLNNNNAGQKLLQVPFFVAPLNFQPPAGFAKIPFPPPHIGSVVLSNITTHSSDEEGNIPTPSSLDQQTVNYKDAFTIPADISSISPQLPSLINSLQEDEFAGISSTESLTEPTEEPTHRYRRPTNSRRHNNRGSHRASDVTSTTTRRPSSRQRRPSSRYNQRNNQQTDIKENIPETNVENNYFTNKANRRPELIQTQNLPLSQSNKNTNSVIEEQHAPGIQFTGASGNEKQEHRTIENNKENYYANNPALLNYPTGDEIIHPNDGRSGIVYTQGRVENIDQSMAQLFHDTRASGDHQYHKEPLISAINSDLAQRMNANDFSLTQKHDLIKPVNNYEHSAYQSAGEAHLPNLNDGSSRNNGYEELNYRKNLKAESTNLPENQNRKQNFRSQNRFSGVQSGDISSESGLEKALTEQANLSQTDDRNQFRPANEGSINIESPLNTYLENPEVQNTSPSPSIHSEEPNNYRETVNSDKLANAEYQPKYHQNQNIHQTTVKSADYNDQINNYENGHIPQTPKAMTERPIPVRTRSRFRGKNFNQVQQTQPTVPTQSYQYGEEPEKTSAINRNRFSNTQTSDNYDQGASYTVPSENYPSHYTTDQTTSTPFRKFTHGRAGRRPLRPTTSATTTTSTTTTSPPPGKKYLIRTRKPAMGQTRLPSGRGRIRRPTTPTTTTTTTTAPTTVTSDYPRTLPFQWRQPVTQEEYNAKEDFDNPYVNPVEYTRAREPPKYYEGKTSEVQLQNTQRGRDDHYQQGRHNTQSRAETPRRVPNYSYEPEENFPAQKHYETTEGSHYSTTYEKVKSPQYSQDYESTQKPHISKEYETTQKPQYSRDYVSPQKQQHSRDHETEQKAQYSSEYDEATQKPQYTREYEANQKPLYSREYETTQKPQYSREYTTTQKPYYTREYETTRKVFHSRDQETTQKPQYSKEYEPAEKPQFYKNYETAQKIQRAREPEPPANLPQYDEYDVTNKPSYVNDDETTHKPQPIRDFETTRKAQAYLEYDTTQNPYIHQEEVPQKSYNSNPPTRNTQQNHRRRPATVSREKPKNTKYEQPETSNNKETNNDFWNQAVTIQQSQSYVYTPDGNLSPTEETSNSDVNGKVNPLQSDYDDYYNFQEGGQYTSDQSPFPSNDQHVTYTKVKPIQEVGKANQYPEKSTFDKTLTAEVIIEKDPSQNEPVDIPAEEEKNINSGYSTADEYDSKFIVEHEQRKELPILTQNEDEHRPVEDPELKEQGSRVQTGRRRGTWVRVRVKKPKDVFETAESQRFSSVRENSLVPDGANPKLLGDKSSSQKSVSNKTENKFTEIRQSETEAVTTMSSEYNDSSNESNTQSSETKVPEVSTNSAYMQTADSSFTTDTNTETDSQTEPDQNLTTVSSIGIPQEETTRQSTSERFRTSTTTEISLETEICYKGQCIKTKRKKEQNDRGLELAK